MVEHTWRYFNTGRVPQVRIETGDDLVHLKELDRKLWSALSVPVDGLRFDRRTLEFIDTDKDGIIRVPEVIAAVEWALARVGSPDELFKDDPAVRADLDKVLAQEADLAAAELSAADRKALADWEAQPARDAAIRPLGDATAAAEATFAAVEATVDAFFAVPADLPLVTEEPDRTLPLAGHLNPKWADAIAAFANACAKPILKCETLDVLTRAQWQVVKAAFAPWRAWQAAKPVPAADTQAKLIDEERLLRYRLNLVAFLRNFVNQADLYDPKALAVYQTGVLYIDGRSCELCFHVSDAAAHAALAAKSNCCLLYAQLTRVGTGAQRTVCAVVTAGRTASLYAGRHGLFVDRDGEDWDATVTKVVEAQVCLWEAFWAPWGKLFGMVSDQVKKFIGAKQEIAVSQAGKLTSTVPSTANAPRDGAAIASSVAALGMGVGMVGAACAGLVGVLAGLPPWKVAAGLAVLFLMVSLPSTILAWFKLRARDLGAVLNAGGWAVNRPLYFSSRLARTFTHLGRLGGIRWVWLVLLALAAIGVTVFLVWRSGALG